MSYKSRVEKYFFLSWVGEDSFIVKLINLKNDQKVSTVALIEKEDSETNIILENKFLDVLHLFEIELTK